MVRSAADPIVFGALDTARSRVFWRPTRE